LISQSYAQCQIEITELNAKRRDLQDLHCKILRVSIDSDFAYTESRKTLGNIQFPELSATSRSRSKQLSILIEQRMIHYDFLSERKAAPIY